MVVGRPDAPVGDVEVDSRYKGVGYRPTAVVNAVRLAHDSARERVLAVGGSIWQEFNVLDSIAEEIYFNARRFACLPVERKDRHVEINGKSCATAFGA